MKLTAVISANVLPPTIARYAREMRRSIKEVSRRAARGATRRVIDITPPATAGSTGRDARMLGEAKISRQMQAVLAPVRIKGRRKVTHVFGRKLARPVFVQTRELHPDVRGAYHDLLRTRNTGMALRTQRVGRKLYVDTSKFRVELRRRQAQVGTLAAGWAAAARALDVPLQQWIGRHGAGAGNVRVLDEPSRFSMTATNIASGLPANVRAELARRIPYALQYQADAMRREIVAYHERLRRERVAA